MYKVFAVIQFELTSLLARKSFRRTVFLVPFIGFLVYFGALLINRGLAPKAVTGLFLDTEAVPRQAIVDHSGLITEIPGEIKEKIILVDSEETARKMVASGEINSFFVIDENYLNSGKIDFVQRNFSYTSTQEETRNLEIVVTYNLFSNKQAAMRYLQPMSARIVRLGETIIEEDLGGPLQFLLPYVIMMLYFILIYGASSLMLNSVTDEKKNRTMEILLSSLSPSEMLIGKTIALGIGGLLQTAVWLTSGFALLNLAGQSFALPASFQISSSLVAWGLIFFILGYALYSSLMAGLGALAPNLKEGSQATIFIIFPLIIPLFFSSTFASPNALILVIFSIFPLTSPITMISRMSATIVPIWQIVLSIVSLIAAIFLVTRSVARLFRAQYLLSGKPFNAREYFKVLRLLRNKK